MLTAFTTVNGHLQLLERESLEEKNIWLNLINPTEKEIQQVIQRTGIDQDFIMAALDEEERSFIDYDDDQIAIVVDVPYSMGSAAPVIYHTVPMGIFVTGDAVVTVSLRPTEVLEHVIKSRRGNLGRPWARFVLDLLYAVSSYYLHYLKMIDRLINDIESEMHHSLRNEKIVRLMNLEKSLVYFTISLRTNETVLEKLLRIYNRKGDEEEANIIMYILAMNDEDEERLEDVITENRQAIEMCDIYNRILRGMRETFSSIISNNLNIVMRFLTSVTIILAIPTVIFSFYGMNVNLPLMHVSFAFIVITLGTIISMIAGVWILLKKGMF